MNQDNINDFLSKYISFTNNLSNKYNYPDNINHVLYLIIPAFIIKSKKLFFLNILLFYFCYLSLTPSKLFSSLMCRLYILFIK